MKFLNPTKEGLMKEVIVTSLLLLALPIFGCSGLRQAAPIVAATSTFTAVPTLIETGTLPVLSETEMLDTVSARVPEGKPAIEWNGIPIMPGPIAGDGDAESYVFTIKATPQHVREYYEEELLKLGWNQFATEEGGDESLILMFMNTDSAILTVSIISKGDEVLVLLAK
jgi:hypothetical protein